MTERNTSEDGHAMAVVVGRIKGAVWHQHRNGGAYVVGHVGHVKFTAIGKQATAVMNHPQAIMVMITGSLVKDKEGLCCRASGITSLSGANAMLRLVDAMKDKDTTRPQIRIESEEASSC